MDFSIQLIQLKHFFEDASYGKMTIAGTVYPYRTNQPPLYGTGYTSCYPEDKDIVNQPDVDYSIIDGIILFAHDTVSGKSCAAGVSSSEKLNFNTADGEFQLRRSGFRTKFYLPYDYSRTTSSTIAHELMHSFGNPFHSNSYIQDSGKWILQGYGNVFDILGLRSQASHPCSMIKHKLGWLTENEIEYFIETDTFRIYPLEKKLPGKTQCVIIELDNPLDIQPQDTFKFDRLYLEYRGLTGFDYRTSMMRRVGLKDGTYYPNDNNHGLSIIGVDCKSYEYCMPVLIDMHPEPIGGVGASYLPLEASDAPLKLGEKYLVENNSIEIEVINVNEENYIDIIVRKTGINNVESKEINNVNIYPSPIDDYINISGMEGKLFNTKLYDLQGNLILAESGNQKLNIGHLSKGVYILLIEDLTTNKTITKRVVKI